jgi:hypothetical protein
MIQGIPLEQRQNNIHQAAQQAEQDHNVDLIFVRLHKGKDFSDAKEF